MWAFPGPLILPSSVSFWHGALKFTVTNDQPWWKVKPGQPWSCGGTWADNHSPSECLARGKGDSQEQTIKMTFPSDSRLSAPVLFQMWTWGRLRRWNLDLLDKRNRAWRSEVGEARATIMPSSLQHRNEDVSFNKYVLCLAQDQTKSRAGHEKTASPLQPTTEELWCFPHLGSQRWMEPRCSPFQSIPRL